MPAPAVIPAPIAYIKVVAVKKLVVGLWARGRAVRRNDVLPSLRAFSSHRGPVRFTTCRVPREIIYFEKIRVFKAGEFSAVE